MSNHESSLWVIMSCYSSSTYIILNPRHLFNNNYVRITSFKSLSLFYRTRLLTEKFDLLLPALPEGLPRLPDIITE